VSGELLDRVTELPRDAFRRVRSYSRRQLFANAAMAASPFALVGSLADPIFAAFAGLNYSRIVPVMGGTHGA